MNIRIAKRIMFFRAPNQNLKPSAQIPYSDTQIAEAARVFRKAVKRWKRAEPMMSGYPKCYGGESRRSRRTWRKLEMLTREQSKAR